MASALADADRVVEQVTKLPKPTTQRQRNRTLASGRKLRVLKPRVQEDVKTHIATSKLLQFLQNHALGRLRKKPDPTRIAAAKILLDRVVPVLSAVEQTVQHVVPPESELLATIQRLVQSNPALLELLTQRPAIDVSPAPDADAALLKVDNDATSGIAPAQRIE